MTKLYTVQASCIVCCHPLASRSALIASEWLGAAMVANDVVTECPNNCPPPINDPHLRYELVWFEEREHGRLVPLPKVEEPKRASAKREADK